ARSFGRGDRRLQSRRHALSRADGNAGLQRRGRRGARRSPKGGIPEAAAGEGERRRGTGGDLPEGDGARDRRSIPVGGRAAEGRRELGRGCTDRGSAGPAASPGSPVRDAASDAGGRAVRGDGGGTGVPRGTGLRDGPGKRTVAQAFPERGGGQAQGSGRNAE